MRVISSAQTSAHAHAEAEKANVFPEDIDQFGLLPIQRQPRLFASARSFPIGLRVIVAARLLLGLLTFRGSLDAVHFHCGLPVQSVAYSPPRLAARQLARFSVANSLIRPTGLSPALSPASLACTIKGRWGGRRRPTGVGTSSRWRRREPSRRTFRSRSGRRR